MLAPVTVYTLVLRGRKYRYASMEAAQAAASDYFNRTRIVLGIVEEKA